jgi:hypothetical protein
MARKVTLSQWIREALTDSEKDAPISMMSLIHMVGAAEREIHSVKFGNKQWTDTELGQMFQHKAESYCQEIPGVQQFCLLAFYGNDPEPQARHPFLINGETDFGGMATEGPTPNGMWAQGLRHLEVSTQLMLRQVGTLFETSNRTIELLGKQNHELMKENRDAINVVKEMLMDRANNAHQHTMQELEYQRSTEERKRWLSFAPPLINTILGKELFPQSTADTALIEAIADAISEEDIAKLAGVLKPELWGPLASRFGDVLQKKRLSAGSAHIMRGNPEDDAAGD